MWFGISFTLKGFILLWFGTFSHCKGSLYCGLVFLLHLKASSYCGLVPFHTIRILCIVVGISFTLKGFILLWFGTLSQFKDSSYCGSVFLLHFKAYLVVV